MRPIELTLEELNRYRKDETVQYAYCSKTQRELRLSFKGEMIIKKAGKEVARTMFQKDAITIFNNL